jgi:hypothetical protein
MTAVEDLVARGVSGVLEVTGSPSGAIYLDGGHIAYAQASWVAGLGAQLRAISPALAALGEPPAGQDADDAAFAGLAVRGGYLTPARVHELIRSIVVDAFLVLTIPFAPDSPVAAIRFTATRTYWTDMFPRLSIDLVRQEACRRAEQMAELGLAPTTTVVPRDLTAPAAVLTREQWAMACQIGDRSSARDLALQRGASLSDTIQCLGSLVRAGLCTPVRAAGRGPLGAPGPDWIAPGQSAPGQSDPGPMMPDWIAPEQSPAPQSAAPQGPAPQSAGRQSAMPLSAPVLSAPPLAPPAPAPERPRPALEHQRPALEQPRPAMEQLPPRRRTDGARDRLDRHVPPGAGLPPSVDILRQVLSGLRKLA